MNKTRTFSFRLALAALIFSVASCGGLLDESGTGSIDVSRAIESIKEFQGEIRGRLETQALINGLDSNVNDAEIRFTITGPGMGAVNASYYVNLDTGAERTSGLSFTQCQYVDGYESCKALINGIPAGSDRSFSVDYEWDIYGQTGHLYGCHSGITVYAGENTDIGMVTLSEGQSTSCGTGGGTTSAGGPDLTVSINSVSGSGPEYTVNVTVTNNGDEDIITSDPDIFFGAWVDRTSAPSVSTDWSQGYGTLFPPGLAAGDSATEDITVWDYDYPTSGTAYVYVDIDENITESNESNNTASYNWPSSGGGTGGGTVTGTVVDATTGSGLYGATVSVSGQSISSTSDYSGNFTLSNVPAGSRTIDFSHSSYTNRSESVSVSDGFTTDMGNITLSPTVFGDDIRAVLTWGASPSDLDFHVLTPGGQHIYYGITTGTGINLDVDDTSGYGPETITITTQETGTYTFYVHNYSGSTSTTLSNSGARVEVYDSTGLIRTVNVAGGSNSLENYWSVLTLNGGSVTVDNTFGLTAPTGGGGGAASTGTLTVWSSASLAISYINVSVDGSSIGQITSYYTSGSATCGAATDTATITTTLNAGTHALTAYDAVGSIWSNSITITDGSCILQELGN